MKGWHENKKRTKFRISNLLSEEHITKSANKKKREWDPFVHLKWLFYSKRRSWNEYGNDFCWCCVGMQAFFGWILILFWTFWNWVWREDNVINDLWGNGTYRRKFPTSGALGSFIHFWETFGRFKNMKPFRHLATSVPSPTICYKASIMYPDKV